MTARKRPTQRDRVLSMLRAAGASGVSTDEFIEARIPRFSARIEELRERGQKITTTRERASRFRYRLAAPERLFDGRSEPF